MGRTYNIIERLKNRNKKPTVMLDEEHCYPINTSKTNVLCIMAYVRKTEKKNDPEADIKMTDHIIKMALGEEAAQYIESQDYTFAVTQDIVDVIMAAITDEEATFEKEEAEKK